MSLYTQTCDAVENYYGTKFYSSAERATETPMFSARSKVNVHAVTFIQVPRFVLTVYVCSVRCDGLRDKTSGDYPARRNANGARRKRRARPAYSRHVLSISFVLIATGNRIDGFVSERTGRRET